MEHSYVSLRMMGHNPPSKLHPVYIKEIHTSTESMLYSGILICFFNEVATVLFQTNLKAIIFMHITVLLLCLLM